MNSMTMEQTRITKSFDVEGFLRLLHPEGVFEVRIFKTPERKNQSFKATAAGYFNDAKEASKEVDHWERTASPPGIYVTLNPTKPELLARSKNRIQFRTQFATKDENIIRRTNLLIDIDSIRESDTSATLAEVQGAIGVAKEIKDWLSGRGWPSPIMVMSGNGAYLIYRIDLANDDTSLNLVKSFLHAVGAKFGSKKVSVDPSVFNASRIAKIAGTWARKGSNLIGEPGIEDRPHRQSFYIAPDAFEVVDTSLIESVASEFEATSPPTEPKSRKKSGDSQTLKSSGSPASPGAVSRCSLYVDTMEMAVEGQHGHDKLFRVCCEIGRFGLTTEQAMPILEQYNKRCLPPFSMQELERKLQEGFAKVQEEGELGIRLEGEESIYVSPSDPVRLANENIERYRLSGRDIRFYRGQWFTYKGRCWEQRTDTYMKARFLAFIDERFKEHCEAETKKYWEDIKLAKYSADEKKPPEKRKISSGLVRNVADATQTICLVPDQIEFETLIESKVRRNFWPVQNGLLDLDRYPTDPEDSLLPHSPDWFSTFCHDYQYDVEADCPKWKQFLASVFSDNENGKVDYESIGTLQRWFGYCLMPHIRLQKMLILDGVSRSGKGVIARVLKRLVGERYTASPKLREFAGDFGLQPLLGKRLAVIGDAKLDRYRHDTEAVLETLLGVIGEDSQDVNIKRLNAVTSCKLNVKFMLLCNGIPALNDPAMAIVNRVVVLRFKRSFVNAEDTELTEKLYGEMDGIFSWSLKGFEDMVSDFRLPQPKAGEDAVESFRKAVSPIRGFVDECCHLRPDDPGEPQYICDRDEFYMAWQGYCEEIGRDRPGTRASLIRQLTNAYPQVVERRPRDGECRRFKLVNIELNEVGRKNVTKKRDQPNKQGGGNAMSQSEAGDEF